MDGPVSRILPGWQKRRPASERAALIAWGGGLGGALIATLAVLKAVFLILRNLDDILRLATMIRDEARGIAVNAEAIAGLEAVHTPAQELRRVTGALADSASAIEERLAVLPGD